MTQRRQFLKSCAGAGLASWLGNMGHFGQLSAAVAADADVGPEIVRLRPEIEPIVQLIEKTPREKCLDMMIEQLRRGLPYRQFLAALYLAGIRNVNPQPPGFKFHCVFVIHAAHQISLDAPVQDRLLPLFWALDNFKVSQRQDVEQGDFHMAPVKGPLPSSDQMWPEFHAAMEAWDEERADRAIVALARHRGSNEIIEGLWRYGARDYRNIGHKAIFVANTWRTLQTIGWQHAEPALRSLVLGLLDFGRDERVNEYAYEDQAYVGNVERARRIIGKLPGDWVSGNGNPAATRELLAAFRTAKMDECCQAAIDRLDRDKANAQTIWDAVHLWAGELMMRQPGIYGIHTVTSVNGLRYAYETAADPETRLLMLLQGVGWMNQFQRFMATKNNGLKEASIVDLIPAESTEDEKADKSIDDILALTSVDAPAAARKAMALALADQTRKETNDTRRPQVDSFARSAYRLVIRKGTDAHDYKYSAAIFEDYNRVSPAWRPHMLATAVYYLRGSSLPDSPLLMRAIDAVKTL